MNEIPDLSSNSAHGFTEGSELTTARRILSETPQHVRDEVREIANQQAGRYMSDAEIDADRLRLIKFLDDNERILLIMTPYQRRQIITRYKIEIGELPANDEPKESEKSSSPK